MGRTKGTLVCAVLALAVLACAPKAGRARLSEGEKLADRTVELLDDAEKALDELDADRAESKLREADSLLKDPRTTRSPDGALLIERYKALEPRVTQTRTEKGRREIAQRVAQRRAVLAKSVKAFRLAIVDLQQNSPDRERIEAARRAANQLESDLAWDRDLQDKDPDFKNYVESLRIDLQNAPQQLALAERAAEFAQGPARDHDEALALVGRTRSDKTLEARVEHLQAARDRYRLCSKRAASLISANPGLERWKTVAAIAKSCDAQIKSLEKRIAPMQKTLEKRSAKKGGKKQKRASR
jgi:hypothetical protein